MIGRVRRASHGCEYSSLSGVFRRILLHRSNFNFMFPRATNGNGNHRHRATVSRNSYQQHSFSSKTVVASELELESPPPPHFPESQTVTESHLVAPLARPPTSTATFESKATVVQKHDLLHHGCLSYPKTWAFQQVLLQRRLQHRRQQSQGQSQSDSYLDRDRDCVILLEHSPVYTLGRGADEKHLTFVEQQQNHHHLDDADEQSQSRSQLQSQLQLPPPSLYSSSVVLEKLSRKVRGPGTARLSMDKTMELQIRDLATRKDGNDGESSDGGSDGDGDGEQAMLSLVERLTESVSPVIAPNGVPVYRVDRGGEVTFHGPSQLVVYPMLDLKNETVVSYQADLHWYLRTIEEVIIRTLRRYGIDGHRDVVDDNTGVWVGDSKVAAVGISSSRWITTHGFALNVDPDLSAFDTSMILPCGIEGKGVTSMGEILRRRRNASSAKGGGGRETIPIPSVAEVAGVVTETMEDVFGVTIQ